MVIGTGMQDIRVLLPYLTAQRHAIIGISDDGRLVYSFSKMVECLMLSESMSYEEAVEFIDYNTLRAIPYMGEKAPIVMYKI